MFLHQFPTLTLEEPFLFLQEERLNEQTYFTIKLRFAVKKFSFVIKNIQTIFETFCELFLLQ